jgi:hypothetical protein
MEMWNIGGVLGRGKSNKASLKCEWALDTPGEREPWNGKGKTELQIKKRKCKCRIKDREVVW